MFNINIITTFIMNRIIKVNKDKKMRERESIFFFFLFFWEIVNHNLNVMLVYIY
jgi:hypothetical protein